jgi:hypothetical protein
MAEMMLEGFRIFWLASLKAVVNWQKLALSEDLQHF